MKLLKVSDEVYQYYKTNVRGNENITLDQVKLKLSRNVQLVKETAPERIKLTWIGYMYSYGNLDITVRLGKVVNVKNNKGLGFTSEWHFPKKRYIELNKKLGITDCKFSKKRKKVI